MRPSASQIARGEGRHTGNGFSRLLGEESAAQIAEFALSLPILLLFVIGIFDFSGAVTLKQKLTNAAREGARAAAAGPAGDLSDPSQGIPASVSDAFQVVDNYFLAEAIPDCGLNGSPPAFSSGLKWVATANAAPCTSTSGIVLTINRACIQNIAASSISAIATCVTVQYPYQWQYGKAASLIGSQFTGPTSIITTAVAFNEN